MRRVLVGLTLLYILTAGIGAWISVERRLPYGVFDGGAPAAVQRDVLVGWGTAYSPSVLALGAALLLAVLASSPRGGGRFAAGLLALLAVGALGNALATARLLDTLRTPETDTVLAVVSAALVVLPVLVVIAAVAVLASEERPRY